MQRNNQLDSFDGKSFEDEFGYTHKTKIILGQGGQGIVYRTHDVDLALKVSLHNGQPLTESNDIIQARRDFNRIKYLPLEGLKLSTPISMLENEVGYIMPLMSDMKPFSMFIYGQQNPSDIKSLEVDNYIFDVIPNEEEARIMAFYIKSHGVKRRLKALYRCAIVLHQLHNRALFFADINPNNEFVSSDLNYDDVWLIDVDNVNYDFNRQKTSIYFPKYGSPEVVQQKGFNSIASDCYSFAILSHLVLAQHHPFDGMAVDGSNDDNGGWDNDGIDGSANSLDKMERGELPWIFCENDKSNIANIALHSIIKEPEIFKLFQQTFEVGKFDIYQRPSMNLWAIGLAKLHDKLLSCPKCHFTFESLDSTECDLCKTKKPNFLKISVFNHYDRQIWQFVEIINHESIKIPTRIISDVDNEQGNLPLFDIKIVNNEIFLNKHHEDWQFIILDNQKEWEMHHRFKCNLNNPNIEIKVKNIQDSSKLFLLKLDIIV